MKTLHLFIVSLFAISSIAFAGESDSAWKLKSVSFVKVGLLDFTEHALQFQNIRYQADVVNPPSPLSGFFQIETMNMAKKNANWFRLLWINFKNADGWEFRAGRLFQAAPYYTTPTPAALRFAKFPRDPWTYYAYGAQTERSWKSGWSVIADVTGRAGLSFSDKRNFDHAEASGRLAKKIGAGHVGLGFMSRPKGTLVHLEGRLVLGRSSVSGVAYADRENGDDITGTFVNVEQDIGKGFFLHGRTDIRDSARRGNSGTIHTTGAMFETLGKRLRLILDYERHAAANTDKFFGIAQYKM